MIRARAPIAAAALLLPWAPAQAFPDTERVVIDLGSTPVALAVSDDDRLVASVSEGGTLELLDTADLGAGTETVSTCSGPVSLDFDRVDGEARFYVTCSGGSVTVVPVDTTDIPAAAGETSTIEIGTGTLSAATVSTADHRLFAVEDATDSYLVHVVDLADGTLDGLTGFPMTTLFAASAMTATPLGTYVVIAHEEGRVTKLFNSGGVYSITTFDLLGLGSFADAEAVDEGYVYLLETSGSLVQYWLTGDVNYMPMASGLSTPREFDIVPVDDTYVFAVVDSAGLLTVIPYTGGDPEAEIALSAVGGEGLAGASADEGRVYVGAESGLVVVGSGPWVEITSVEPREAHEGDTVTLTFTVDEDCSYDLYLGGDIDESGEHLSAYDGSAGEGDSVALAIDSADLAEGDNRLFLFATASGYTGRDSDTVYLDTPPDAVAGFEVGFGNGKLFVRWEASDESDISHYLIYFADAYFDESSGAPEFSVEGSGTVISSPVEAEHGEAGESLTYTLDSLTNGVEYCLALQGVDQGGQEGPWTETLCEAPENTVGSGDDLGYCGACAAQDPGIRGPAFAAALMALVGVLAHRRVRLW